MSGNSTEKNNYFSKVFFREANKPWSKAAYIQSTYQVASPTLLLIGWHRLPLAVSIINKPSIVFSSFGVVSSDKVDMFLCVENQKIACPVMMYIVFVFPYMFHALWGLHHHLHQAKLSLCMCLYRTSVAGCIVCVVWRVVELYRSVPCIPRWTCL